MLTVGDVSPPVVNFKFFFIVFNVHRITHQKSGVEMVVCGGLFRTDIGKY